MKVKALPANLPDFIEADITELEIGNKLYITSLKNEKYTILHPDNTVVAQVRMSRNAAKAAVEGKK
jgi:large subunit ribosomal protein L25